MSVMTKAIKETSAANAAFTPFQHPALELVEFSGKGRGVIVSEAVKAGEVLEIAPVIRLSDAHSEALNDTLLASYVFEWDEGEYPFALVMGTISIINHSRAENVTLSADFASQSMSLTAKRDISAGEELVFDYDCDIWFDEHEEQSA